MGNKPVRDPPAELPETCIASSDKQWVQDSAKCMLCAEPFTPLFRRHHCRACGILICGNCSKTKWVFLLDSKGKRSRRRFCTNANPKSTNAQRCAERFPQCNNCSGTGLSGMRPFRKTCTVCDGRGTPHNRKRLASRRKCDSPVLLRCMEKIDAVG